MFLLLKCPLAAVDCVLKAAVGEVAVSKPRDCMNISLAGCGRRQVFAVCRKATVVIQQAENNCDYENT